MGFFGFVTEKQKKLLDMLTIRRYGDKRDIANHLAEIQLGYQEEILSSQRYTLNENYSMEVIVLNGISSRLTELSEKLISEKGIQHGKLNMTRFD